MTILGIFWLLCEVAIAFLLLFVLVAIYISGVNYIRSLLNKAFRVPGPHKLPSLNSILYGDMRKIFRP